MSDEQTYDDGRARNLEALLRALASRIQELDRNGLLLDQAGELMRLIGDVRSDIDISYLADATLMFRFFEAEGAVRSAITAVKSRTAQNERTIRELRISAGGGLRIGEPIVDFAGVIGEPVQYSGVTKMLRDRPA